MAAKDIGIRACDAKKYAVSTGDIGGKLLKWSRNPQI
jgi:hypothetical protein